MNEWKCIDSAPEGKLIETKIDDGMEKRNFASLIKKGNLWFMEDMSMYVYYQPTHWRML